MPDIDYKCPSCGWSPKENELSYDNYEWAHCPNCLCGVHETDDEGCECGGVLEPISIWVNEKDEWFVIQKCRFCGEVCDSPVSDDDSPIKILSLAVKPLSKPPFPIEKMQKLTEMMGGSGNTEGYYDEQRK